MKISNSMTVGSALAFTVLILAKLVAVSWWMVGLVVAQGFWCTTFALLPLYGWYLATEWLMNVVTF